jgi:hypothetical protein
MKLPNDAVERLRSVFESVDLGDARRDRRLGRIVSKLAKRPSASLPAAMGTEADLEGLYRFANNEDVHAQDLFDAFASHTARRAKKAGRVLVIHDTTTCQPPRGDVDEVGQLSTGNAGFFVHPSLVLDAGEWKRPLGVVNVETIFRLGPRKAPRGKKVSGAETAKWKNRESERWTRGVEKSAQLLKGCKEVVHVADREGDSYEFLGSMVAHGRSFVVRVSQRRMVAASQNADAARVELQEHVGAITGILERDVELTARKTGTAPRENKAHPPRRARIAKLAFAATKAVLRRPGYLHDPIPETLSLNVVRVWEPDPPEGESPVQWFLMTTLSTTTKAKVAAIVDTYRARWTIEEFNKALKTGCAYESREFESSSALLTILAISVPIACELLWLRSRARAKPDAPAREVVSARQIQILRAMGTRPMPKQPTVRDALLAIAALGGHLKRNGEPGWQVLYRGYKELLSYEAGWNAALKSRAKM